MAIELPSEIATALRPIVEALAVEGFTPTQIEQEPSFGNFSVVFARDAVHFSIVRDRGQFHVGDVDRSALEAAGLWCSFSGPNPIIEPLLVLLRAQLQANQALQPTASGRG